MQRSLFLHYARLTVLQLELSGVASFFCHIPGFACQQPVLKTFPGRGFPLFENGKVGYMANLLNFDIYAHLMV